MKKITILSLHLNFGGIEKMVASLANILAEKHEVEIVSVYKLTDKPAFDINKDVKLKYLMENRCPNREEFKQAVKSFNIFKMIIEAQRAVTTLFLRKKKTVQEIKNNDADVIISTRDIFNLWLSKYGNRNKTLIGWEHNHHSGNDDYVKKIVKSVEGLDYFVLVSDSLEKFYKKKLKESNSKCKAVYIPNVLDEIPEKGTTHKNKRIISVGRLSPEKSFNDLIEVFELVNKKRPDWTLDIIGDGPQNNFLVNKTYEMNLHDKVTFHGFRSKEYINDLLSKSSIYAMTSLTESFGIVLLEAMSHGLPCVAFTSAEGANDLIEMNKTGYLVRNRSIKQMAKRIVDLIDDVNKRKKLGKAGRKKSLEFTPEAVKEKWLVLVEKEIK